MAIIRYPEDRQGIIPRPVLAIGPEGFDAPAEWSEFETRKSKIEKAAGGVARIEIAGALTPFAGTAFLVGKKLAVTASFVGEALLSSQSGHPTADEPGLLAPDSIHLNLSNDGRADTASRLAVRRVHAIHPHWRAAFLELEDAVQDDLPLALAMHGRATMGRRVCVIGFPAQDARSRPDVASRVFLDTYGTKRLMPGQIIEPPPQNPPEPMLIGHDASTLGGVAGAPIIDMETGEVLGIHVGGLEAVGNFAVPAWELTRDPQWAPIWHLGQGKEPVSSNPGKPKKAPQILTIDDIFSIQETIINLGSGQNLQDLLVGLPSEFIASFRVGDNYAASLGHALSEMNKASFFLGKNIPIYIFLRTARNMRSFDPDWITFFDPLIAKILEFETSAIPNKIQKI